MNAIAITLHPAMKLSDDEYYEFCRLNPDTNFEMDRDGRLLIVPPTGGWTGNKNLKLTTQLGVRTDKDGTAKSAKSAKDCYVTTYATTSIRVLLFQMDIIKS